MKQRVISLLLATLLFLSMLPTVFVANAAVNIPDNLHLKQGYDGDHSCVYTSVLNMLRRRAYIDGRSDWAEIDWDNYRKTIAASSTSYAVKTKKFTVKDMDVFCYRNDNGYYSMSKAEKKNHLIKELKSHPEGIVLRDCEDDNGYHQGGYKRKREPCSAISLFYSHH